MKPLIAGFLIIISMAGNALAVDDDAFLKNTVQLKKLLTMNGVNPSTLLWNSIESACVPLKTQGNTLDYNRCRFDKARDQALFNDDKVSCRDESLAIYPDSLAQRKTETVVTQTADATTATSISRPSSSIDDIRARRRYAFDQCMSEKGWMSSRNYLMGKRD